MCLLGQVSVRFCTQINYVETAGRLMFYFDIELLGVFLNIHMPLKAGLHRNRYECSVIKLSGRAVCTPTLLCEFEWVNIMVWVRLRLVLE